MAAAPAGAAESAWPTAQAKAYNAEWVPYLDPPEKPAAVCLVDSGVAITPDTPADSPDGPIVKRLALDGGSGEAAGSSWEQMHGTRMAMVGAAPMNGWGTIGAWPGLRIVSVRAMPMGEAVLPFDVYQRAIATCEKFARDARIAVVNLSLVCHCVPERPDEATLSNRVQAAHQYGLNVVASAGNDAADVASPASEPGAFGVGATDNDLTLCLFSNRGSALDAVGPGCGMDFADPWTGVAWHGYNGATSAAAMTVSAVIALVRSYRPDLTWDEVESAVRDAARPANDLKVLDVGAVFRLAGLSELATRAQERQTEANNPGPPVPVSTTPSGGEATESAGPTGAPRPAGLAAPHIWGVRWARGRLRFVVNNRPHGARVVVQAERREGEFGYHSIAHATVTQSRISISSHRRPQRVLVTFACGQRVSKPAIWWDSR